MTEVDRFAPGPEKMVDITHMVPGFLQRRTALDEAKDWNRVRQIQDLQEARARRAAKVTLPSDSE